MSKKDKIQGNFESALTRLEQIVTMLENGEGSLDDSLTAFEEGVALVKYCNDKLTQAEQKVRILLENDAGEMQEVAFEAQVS